MDRYGKLSFVIICVALILVSGCVSKKQYKRDMNTLNSQVSTLSSEVYRIDSEAKAGQQKGFFGMGHKEAVSQGGGASPIYRTPSGFEIPAVDVQRALKGAGYYDGPVDGEVGPSTREAIRKFQKDAGLHADGVCGRKTWELLKTHLDKSGAAAIK